MKKFFALATVFALFATTTVDAARIVVEPGGLAPNDTYSIFLDGEGDNGNFDTVIVSLSPEAGAFANIDTGVDGTTPRGPGDEFTYINAFLSAPVAFGGNGFSVLGPVTETTGVEFTGGPLGATIDTTGPNTAAQGLFLATVNLPGVDVNGAGLANVQLVSGGSVIADLSAPIGIPEPTTMVLAGLSLVGIAATRRRS